MFETKTWNIYWPAGSTSAHVYSNVHVWTANVSTAKKKWIYPRREEKCSVIQTPSSVLRRFFFKSFRKCRRGHVISQEVLRCSKSIQTIFASLGRGRNLSTWTAFLQSDSPSSIVVVLVVLQKRWGSAGTRGFKMFQVFLRLPRFPQVVTRLVGRSTLSPLSMPCLGASQVILHSDPGGGFIRLAACKHFVTHLVTHFVTHCSQVSQSPLNLS